MHRNAAGPAASPATAASTQQPAVMTARFIERARELERLADTRRIRDRLQAIFESDRWSTWDH